MIYIKYIMLLLVFLISYLIGLLISKRFKNRVNELRIFKENLNIIETKIRFTYKPLKDIFEEISNNTNGCNNNILKIFKETSIYLKNNDIKTSWKKSLEASKSKISLNDEDINILNEIGNFLRENRYRGSNK